MPRMCALFAVTMVVAAESLAAAAAPSESQPVIVALAPEPAKYDPIRLGEADLRHARNRADRFAAWSGLALLTDESPNEVRIWQAISAIVPGIRFETWSYVITPSQALACKITYSQGGSTASHDGCEIIGQASHARELAPLVAALLPHANSGMGCGIADGNHYTLDIVHDGKRSFISATNPDICRDAGSLAVASLINAMQHLRHSISPSR